MSMIVWRVTWALMALAWLSVLVIGLICWLTHTWPDE